jgi:phosphoglycolate phosphatase
VTPARPRALLFDWDNTLVDSWSAIHHALKATFEAMGRQPWTLDETRARVRRSARESFPALFGARADEAAEIFYRTFENEHLANLCAREGADLLLHGLAEGALYYLAVVSNKRGDLLRREAAHLGWDKYFGRLVGALDAARDKPAVEAVEMALAESGHTPGPQVWFVGDTNIDMQCAVEAGCLPVLLRPDPPQHGEFEGAAPRIHVASCAHLLEKVNALRI